MPEANKPTIDQRIEALVMSLELERHEREAAEKRWEKRARLLDARERQARQALLAGVSAYLEVIAKPVEGEEEDEQHG